MESVKILIDAEDRATAKVEQASRAIESNIKNIRQVGGQAKASTEFISVIANVAGNSQLGALAGQLGQVTEKMGQFAEIQKLGGSGALAFKAGLVGLVGTMSFQFGKAIGDAVFGTEYWTKKLAEANAMSEKLSGQLAKMSERRFSFDMQEIEIIRNPAEKQAAYSRLLAGVEKNLAGLSSQVRAGEKEVAAWDAAWFKFGSRAAFADQAKEKLEDDRKRLGVMEDQAEKLREMTSVRQRELELMKEQAAIEGKSMDFVTGLKEEYELAQKIADARREASTYDGGMVTNVEGLKAAIEEIQFEASAMARAEEKVKLSFTIDKTTVPEDRSEANQIAEKILQLKEMAKIEEEAKKKESQRLEEAKKLALAREDEIQKLRHGVDVLEKGKDIAEEIRRAEQLEKMGFTQEESQKIVNLEKKLQPKQIIDTPDLMGMESRLLVGYRSPTEDKDPQKAVVEKTEEVKNVLQEILNDMRARPQSGGFIFEPVN